MDRNFEEMSPVERIKHIQELWDRIAAHPKDVPVSASTKAELRRRLAEHNESPSDTISWGKVKAKSRRRK